MKTSHWNRIYMLLIGLISGLSSLEAQSGHDQLKQSDYARYILIKGEQMVSVKKKLTEYGELSAKGKAYVYKFESASLGDWTIVKVPKGFRDYYEFYNLAYWFLGYPPEDQNYAKQVIALAVNSDNVPVYCLFNDDDLTQKHRGEDVLFGALANNERFMLSIPFDEYTVLGKEDSYSFQELPKQFDFDIKAIVNGSLKFKRMPIKFNQK